MKSQYIPDWFFDPLNQIMLGIARELNPKPLGLSLHMREDLAVRFAIGPGTTVILNTAGGAVPLKSVCEHSLYKKEGGKFKCFYCGTPHAP